jgi:acyl-CoA synthetase (AMP-forming)/AMP-acid ligase II
VNAGDPALIRYASGTTGRAKGVVLTQQSLTFAASQAWTQPPANLTQTAAEPYPAVGSSLTSSATEQPVEKVCQPRLDPDHLIVYDRGLRSGAFFL